MLKYISGSTGKTISLYSEKIKGRLKKAGFYDFEWNVKEIDKMIGCTVEGFEKKPKKYELILDFVGSAKERAENADLFFETTEVDVLNEIPGRLYFRDYYLECYVIRSEAGGRDDRKRMVQKKATVYAPYPFWRKEETYYIPPIDIEGEWELLEVPASLPNTNFTGCHYRLRAYGPFPSQWVGLNKLFFYINDNQVQVDYTCKENEYIELDTRDETIVLVDAATGSRSNIYHLQNFNLDTFKKIPPGENVLKYDRSYAMEITLFHERSEPKWSEETPETYFFITSEDRHPLMTEDGYYIVGAHQKGGAT